MIPFNNLKRGFELFKEEYENKVLEVLNSGWYVLGNEVKTFEEEFSQKIGAAYTIGVDNGLNAISLGIRALDIGKGDEVIVQSNTYIATVLGISHNGAIPVFIEPDEYYNIDASKIEEKITSKTKAVLVTHLYGQAADMKKIKNICDSNNIFLLEDCAQSHFAKNDKKNTGTFGIMGFFSFYPTKNLGAFGDGGAITTDSKLLAEKLKGLRNYGSCEKYLNKYIGFNARLDEMQAALLRIKLRHIESLNEERKFIADKYLSGIGNKKILLPKVRKNCTSVWHLFVVRCEERTAFREYLAGEGIGTDIHYPVPPHLSEAYKDFSWKKGDFPIAENFADTVVSIPIFNGMRSEEVNKVIDVINSF